MKKRMNPDYHIGKVYGIYTIIELMSYKDKWNHHLYKGVCNECGYEKIAPIGDFKNKNVQKCTHFGLLTIEQKDSWYEKNKKKCLCCGQYIPLGDMYFSEYKELKFCSRNCAASYINQTTKKKENNNFCPNCGTKISSKNKYCSIECMVDFNYKSYIERWKNGLESGAQGKYQISGYIKRYLIGKYNNKCSQCGWSETNKHTGKIPLEVHHKDGDYTNNTENNLDLLCPNCHSLTATYKAANKGNGRKDRKKYT